MSSSSNREALSAICKMLDEGLAFAHDGEIRLGRAGRNPNHPSKPTLVTADGTVTRRGLEVAGAVSDGPVRRMFTFGPDQGSQKVPEPAADWVCVIAPEGADHRALFIAWLGSNNFSSEYSEEEFTQYVMKYAPNPFPIAVIRVEERASGRIEAWEDRGF